MTGSVVIFARYNNKWVSCRGRVLTFSKHTHLWLLVLSAAPQWRQEVLLHMVSVLDPSTNPFSSFLCTELGVRTPVGEYSFYPEYILSAVAVRSLFVC